MPATHTRVIFLDIDGPMIPVKAYYLPNQTKPASVFDPIAVAMLNELLNDSAVQLVISSVWAKQGKQTIVDVLSKNGIDPNRLHEDWMTPRRNNSARHHEIRWWLNNHPEVVDYVALDDERLDVNVVPNFVQCCTSNGMSHRNYSEARYYLNMTNQSGPSLQQHDRERHWEMITQQKRREITLTVRVGEPQLTAAIKASTEIFPLFKDQ